MGLAQRLDRPRGIALEETAQPQLSLTTASPGPGHPFLTHCKSVVLPAEHPLDGVPAETLQLARSQHIGELLVWVVQPELSEVIHAAYQHFLTGCEEHRVEPPALN